MFKYEDPAHLEKVIDILDQVTLAFKNVTITQCASIFSKYDKDGYALQE